MEPDIEIQTLSDEFQMDCEDAEPRFSIFMIDVKCLVDYCTQFFLLLILVRSDLIFLEFYAKKVQILILLMFF